MNILGFRNMAAEGGLELTPKEAEEMLSQYGALKDSIEKAYKDDPNFYNNLKNLTTEQRFEKIDKFKSHGINMNYNEFSATVKVVLRVCELEGYV
jgi:hypothetical protein